MDTYTSIVPDGVVQVLGNDGIAYDAAQGEVTMPSSSYSPHWFLGPDYEAQVASDRAKVENTEAVAGVDDGLAQHGNRIERLSMATVLVALDAVNAERATMEAMNTAVQAATSLADLKAKFAAINFPPQVTQAQLQNAVKSKLGTFPT